MRAGSPESLFRSYVLIQGLISLVSSSSRQAGISKQTAELQLNHGTVCGVPEMAQETPTSTNGMRLVDCILLDAGQWLDWTSWMRVLSTQ